MGLVRSRDGLEEGGRDWRVKGAVVLAAVAVTAMLGCQTRAASAPPANASAPAIGLTVTPGAVPPSAAAPKLAVSRPPAAPDEANHPPLTKDQAKELFRSVDEILSFASKDTDLPIVHSVKRKLITRDEVTRYLSEKFNEDEIGRASCRERV